MLIIELSFFAHMTPGDLDLWPLDMKMYTALPLVIIYLPTKFEGDRLKTKEISRNQSKW